MTYTYEELQPQLPDAQHIYVGCTVADSDNMMQDFWRVSDGGGAYAIGTVNPEPELADKEIFPTP
jgi:hypothetical protein